MVASIGLYLATLVASDNPMGGGGLFNILSPDTRALFLFGASGAIPVFGMNRWWTVLSAGWLHGGLLHIAFNLLWVRQLAPATADLFGPGRMILIYVVGGAAGFLLSSAAGYYLAGVPMLRGAGFTIGASSPIFALLGALVQYGHRTGSSLVRGQALQYAAIMFAFGLFMSGVDNYAHAGGFGGGWLMAKWLDPMARERVDHLILGLLSLLATALAIVASIIFGLPYVMR
jgi:rhomboid protease GluP